jgi:hypothetical protein
MRILMNFPLILLIRQRWREALAIFQEGERRRKSTRSVGVKSPQQADNNQTTYHDRVDLAALPTGGRRSGSAVTALPSGGSGNAGVNPVALPRGGSSDAGINPVALPRGGSSDAGINPVALPSGGSSDARRTSAAPPSGGSGDAGINPVALPSGDNSDAKRDSAAPPMGGSESQTARGNPQGGGSKPISASKEGRFIAIRGAGSSAPASAGGPDFRPVWPSVEDVPEEEEEPLEGKVSEAEGNVP